MKYASLLFALATACATNDPSATKEAVAQDQVYVFESDGNGFNTKTVFYDDGAQVVAFDAQFTPAYAEQAIAFLRTKTAHPLTYLVITHPNPDKFNGLDTFKQAGAKVVASRATAAAMPGTHAYKKNFFVNVAGMFTEATYPQLGTVDVTFAKALDLKLASGRKIQLRELSRPGVSSNQTVAMIPAVNALVVGDLVHTRAHAWLEGGIVDGKPTPTIASWIKDLQELKSRFGASNPAVYGGRGEVARLREAVPQQITYLRKLDRIVADYVRALGDRSSELSGPNAGAHWTALQTSAEAAFPGYALGYMIQYGVYGLAFSDLR